MIKKISNDAWDCYKTLLPKTRGIYEPPLPANLPYQGRVHGEFDYILSDEVLGRLREWLNKRGDEAVYYFMTEFAEGDSTDFEVKTSELTKETLSSVNKTYENALVAKDFSWAIFVDHEGALHVSGPKDLMITLSGD